MGTLAAIEEAFDPEVVNWRFCPACGRSSVPSPFPTDDPSCVGCDKEWFDCGCPSLRVGLGKLMGEMLAALPPEARITHIARATLEHLPTL